MTTLGSGALILRAGDLSSPRTQINSYRACRGKRAPLRPSVVPRSCRSGQKMICNKLIKLYLLKKYFVAFQQRGLPDCIWPTARVGGEALGVWRCGGSCAIANADTLRDASQAGESFYQAVARDHLSFSYLITHEEFVPHQVIIACHMCAFDWQCSYRQNTNPNLHHAAIAISLMSLSHRAKCRLSSAPNLDPKKHPISIRIVFLEFHHFAP